MIQVTKELIASLTFLCNVRQFMSKVAKWTTDRGLLQVRYTFNQIRMLQKIFVFPNISVAEHQPTWLSLKNTHMANLQEETMDKNVLKLANSSSELYTIHRYYLINFTKLYCLVFDIYSFSAGLTFPKSHNYVNFCTYHFSTKISSA